VAWWSARIEESGEFLFQIAQHGLEDVCIPECQT
jgi:hypothetical protein